ncbi:hypothetical protein GCM10017687_11070 [Streptomyces echinatus]
MPASLVAPYAVTGQAGADSVTGTSGVPGPYSAAEPRCTRRAVGGRLAQRRAERGGAAGVDLGQGHRVAAGGAGAVDHGVGGGLRQGPGQPLRPVGREVDGELGGAAAGGEKLHAGQGAQPLRHMAAQITGTAQDENAHVVLRLP